jgi:hypothetical protein
MVPVGAFFWGETTVFHDQHGELKFCKRFVLCRIISVISQGPTKAELVKESAEAFFDLVLSCFFNSFRSCLFHLVNVEGPPLELPVVISREEYKRRVDNTDELVWDPKVAPGVAIGRPMCHFS